MKRTQKRQWRVLLAFMSASLVSLLPVSAYASDMDQREFGSGTLLVSDVRQDASDAEDGSEPSIASDALEADQGETTEPSEDDPEGIDDSLGSDPEEGPGEDEVSVEDPDGAKIEDDSALIGRAVKDGLTHYLLADGEPVPYA